MAAMTTCAKLKQYTGGEQLGGGPMMAQGHNGAKRQRHTCNATPAAQRRVAATAPQVGK